jgi:hypothetical protein
MTEILKRNVSFSFYLEKSISGTDYSRTDIVLILDELYSHTLKFVLLENYLFCFIYYEPNQAIYLSVIFLKFGLRSNHTNHTNIGF